MTARVSIHGQWSSRLVFILAATGSAIGLGNIWKFPYIAGENGGGAFVLVYLLCVALIGLPILIAETLIGRRGRQSPVNSLRTLAREEGGSYIWWLVGFMGIFSGLIILSFYSVIAGWALAYLVRVSAGVFDGITAEGSSSIFRALVSDPERLLAWHTIFMLMTTMVVVQGVRSGLEQAVKLLVPALFILLLVLVGYSLNSGYFLTAVRFLFRPDFSALTTAGVLTAMGHAFFTLSLGMGAIMVYGSYLPAGASIIRASLWIAGVDTLFALLAGVAIFPLVFANDLPVDSGPGLLFQTLPIAFGHMPGGTYVGALFFLMLVLAAWTSAISLIEPAVAWLVENRRLGRLRATFLVAFGVWLCGILTILSFSRWSFSFHFAGRLKNNGWFDILDVLTSGIILPLSGLSIALFAGWVMSSRSLLEELGGRDGPVFRFWYLVIRYLAPAGVVVVFLQAIGVI